MDVISLKDVVHKSTARHIGNLGEVIYSNEHAPYTETAGLFIASINPSSRRSTCHSRNKLNNNFEDFTKIVRAIRTLFFHHEKKLLQVILNQTYYVL